MIGRYSALARRLYHHAVHGGTLKDTDLSYMVESIEELEAEVTRLEEVIAGMTEDKPR